MLKPIQWLRWLLPLISIFLLALLLDRGLNLNPYQIPSPLINRPLPNFFATSLEGKMMTRKDFVGKVALLNVFATWCLSCQAEHPILMDIKNSHAILIYGFNYKDNKEALKAWLKRYGNPYQGIILDPTGEIGIDLGVYGTPETFVLDKRGMIRYKFVGPISPDDWKDRLKPLILGLLEEKP